MYPVEVDYGIAVCGSDTIEHAIRVIQNDIPHYSKTDDRVYRLFIVNKDIFKANELFDIIPLCDQDLKKWSPTTPLAHHAGLCFKKIIIVQKTIPEFISKPW